MADTLLLRFPVIDMRLSLPFGLKKWETRSPNKIAGVVVHHTAGMATIMQETRHHITKGWPRLGYHLWIEPTGEVFLANHPEDVVYSQAGTPPLPFTQPNTNFLSVVFRGDLTHHLPTPRAMLAFRWLWAVLKDVLPIQPDALFPHNAFKATICPGRAQDLVNQELQDVTLWRDRLPRTVKDAQQILLGLGQDLGPAGVDGIIGPRTRAALLATIGAEALTVDAAYRLAHVHHQAQGRAS